jgi:CBS-domain-containing membrane protein
MTMKAREIMTRDVVTVETKTPVRVAAALLAQHRITSLPVVDDDGNVIGIVSELDLLRNRMPHDPRAHMRQEPDERPDPPEYVGDVMTDAVVCLSENADSADLAEVLVNNNVRAVPILGGGELVGIVSRRDVLRTLLRDDSAIAADVTERLSSYSPDSARWQVDVREGVVTVTGAVDERQSKVITSLATTVPGVVRVHVGH